METKATFIVKWKPVKSGFVSSYLTESEEEAIENFKANVRLGFEAIIEAR